MSTTTDTPARTRTGHLGEGTWWHGRSGLLVPLILGAFSTYLLIGILTMEVAEDSDPPGPQFFPMIIMVLGYVITVLLVLAIIRNPEPVDADTAAPAEASRVRRSIPISRPAVLPGPLPGWNAKRGAPARRRGGGRVRPAARSRTTAVPSGRR